MPKKKPAPQPKPSKSQLEATAKCIAAVTGQGIIPSRTIAEKLDPAVATKVAELEEAGKRSEAAKLLR